jgi:hypothetical protein
MDVHGKETPTSRSALARAQPLPPQSRAGRKTSWPTTVTVAALLSECENGSTATTGGITVKLAPRGRRWLVSRLLWY